MFNADMFGKRVSNFGKGRSVKNEFNTPVCQKSNITENNSVNKQVRSATDDYRMPMIELPVIKTQQNAEKLPTYHAVLNRISANGMVLDEELDSLQLELESLISLLATRTNLMHIEIDGDDYKLKDHNKRLKLNVKQPQLSGSRRRNFDKLLPHKGGKMTNNLFKSKNIKRVGSVSGTMSRNSTASTNDLTSELKSELLKPMVIKNDVAFKFWASVEPYCAQLGAADLEKLSKIINKYEEPLPAIPELGPHYTQRWSAEDFLMEQNLSSLERSQPKNVDMNLNIPAHIATMLKKTEGYNGDVPGPLTQRLLSALLHVPELDNLDEKLNSESERILRKELITLGIMKEDDFPKPSPNDEVWEETKRVYSELTALNKQNVEKLKELHNAAQIEIKKTTLRRKLEAIDNQILELHKKFQLAKQEKRTIDEAELEDTQRLLKEQIMLNEKIMSMGTTGPHWIN